MMEPEPKSEWLRTNEQSGACGWWRWATKATDVPPAVLEKVPKHVQEAEVPSDQQVEVRTQRRRVVRKPQWYKDFVAPWQGCCSNVARDWITWDERVRVVACDVSVSAVLLILVHCVCLLTYRNSAYVCVVEICRSFTFRLFLHATHA